jgi:WD40 repeat protein
VGGAVNWHSIEGEVLLDGDYSKILLQEAQRQLLLVGKRNLWIYDLDTFEVNHMLPLEGVVSSSATLDPARRHLFVGTEYGEKLLVVDLHALTVMPTKLKTGCRDIALMAVRKQLYWLGHDAMSIVSLREKRPRVVRQMALKGDQRGICLALSPDEQTLAVGRDGKGELYRAENFSFRSNFELPPGVQQLTFSPDGRLLASAGGLIHSPTLEEGESLFDRIHEAYYTDARLLVWDAGSGALRALSTSTWCGVSPGIRSDHCWPPLAGFRPFNCGSCPSRGLNSSPATPSIFPRTTALSAT